MSNHVAPCTARVGACVARTDVFVRRQVFEDVNLGCNGVVHRLVRHHVDDLHGVFLTRLAMDALADHTRETPERAGSTPTYSTSPAP